MFRNKKICHNKFIQAKFKSRINNTQILKRIFQLTLKLFKMMTGISTTNKKLTLNSFRKLQHSPIAIKIDEANEIDEGILYGDRVVLHP